MSVQRFERNKSVPSFRISRVKQNVNLLPTQNSLNNLHSSDRGKLRVYPGFRDTKLYSGYQVAPKMTNEIIQPLNKATSVSLSQQTNEKVKEKQRIGIDAKKILQERLQFLMEQPKKYNPLLSLKKMMDQASQCLVSKVRRSISPVLYSYRYSTNSDIPVKKILVGSTLLSFKPSASYTHSRNVSDIEMQKYNQQREKLKTSFNICMLQHSNKQLIN